MMKVGTAFTILILGLFFVGCGPETIFVRPGLDTPEQHTSNGHQFLQRGKVEAACREFNRAKELNPRFVKAYVGLGIALGQKGDVDAGLVYMDRARQMAGNEQESAEVRKGYERLDEIRRKHTELHTP